MLLPTTIEVIRAALKADPNPTPSDRTRLLALIRRVRVRERCNGRFAGVQCRKPRGKSRLCRLSNGLFQKVLTRRDPAKGFGRHRADEISGGAVEGLNNKIKT